MDSVLLRQSKRLFGFIGLLCINALAMGVSHASMVPWVGTADYQLAPGAAGDEDIVGPFSSYDFSSNGVVLIKPAAVASAGSFTVGDTYTGYYQSYVNSHNNLLGQAVPSPNLNNTYELTVAANFNERVTGVDASGNAVFQIIDGVANIYFDTAPNRNFATDSGFTDGSSIIQGTISGGSGAFLTSVGVGFSSIDLTIGNLGYDHNVFDPATINGGDGIFTLQINPSGVTSVTSSVMGHGVNAGDSLLQADGNLNLLAVPLPPTAWLLGGALAGLLGFARRRPDALPA